MEITLDQANKIIAFALQRATEAGYKPMAVVVLDAAGHTRSAQRQDGASMFRIDIAGGKAWASIAWAPRRVLTQRAKDLPAFFGRWPPPATASSSRRPARC
jgi:uncharacterized protein GlcG (DUF336 family)